ncbi:MAG TPA: hypothetical protein VH951_07770 [Dehalococcoidia bacterium]|jgi:hypothetical protein
MLHFDAWFKIAFAALMVPPLVYGVWYYSWLRSDLMRTLMRSESNLRATFINLLGPLLFLAVYLLIVATPALGMAAVVDRITDT